ncbi:MAG: hypothetical protein IT353_21395 [Gemmatimonadaceae bacterium]|nr:hypothetical protein [Gemmatimonadaceae bacterium]
MKTACAAYGVLAVLLTASVGAAQSQPKKAPPKDTLSTAEREQIREASRDARSIARRRVNPDSLTRRLRADSASGTAFASPEAKAILARAREARERQDSALTAYRATTTQRMSVGLGARKLGFEKLLFRGDNVAQISWKRGVGVWVNPIGSRMTVPMAERVDGDMVSAVSVPYFPGRETLWFPSSNFGVVKSDIDEREMIHPLARGAEYYYRYETGDSVNITLQGGRVIRVRELRIVARRPQYRLFVGSFWFDRDGGQLVRAAYRMAADLEIWDVAKEEAQIDELESRVSSVLRDSITRARLPRELYVKDSAERARLAKFQGQNPDEDVPGWVSGLFRPARAKLDAITVEYGLYQGKFWLPRANSATASMEFGPMRVPFRIDEKFTYDDVNGDFSLAPLPPPRNSSASSDSARADDSTKTASPKPTSEPAEPAQVQVSVGLGVGGSRAADSSARRDSIRLARMPANKRRQCAQDSVWTRTETRYEGALRIAYAMPCDERKLTTSSALPPAYTADEDLFDVKSRDELLAALDLSLQPAWAPQRPTVRTGSDLLRFNRIEGLSVGLQARQVLGAGYTATAVGRIGYADLHANGELSLARSNGPRTVTATVYHRLNATNPEWSGALSFGSSLPAFLYSRDEGFYYRSFGAELGEKREQRRGALEYKVFIERQYTAGDTGVVNTWSLGRLLGDRRFRQNIIAEPLSVTGVSGAWSRAFGSNPNGFQLLSTTRFEGGTGTYEYARGSLEATLTRPVSSFAVGVTGSIGSSVGDVPRQRNWSLGGLRTVRGQIPGGAYEGDAYWLTRTEVGVRGGAFRPLVFFDAGWAGSREAFSKIQAQRGAGFGFGFLDGLFRVDIARGIYPNKQWRTDLYFGAPL